MIRTILTVDKNNLTLLLPDDFLGKRIEVIAFVIDDIPAILREPIFEKAFKTAEVANMTPQQRDEYEQSRLSYIEVKEAVNTAEMDGYKRAKIEPARELKQSGVDRRIIKKSTGLTDEEIDKL